MAIKDCVYYEDLIDDRPIVNLLIVRNAHNCDIITVISVNDGIPLGVNIPLRVKNKTWADQFVDLKTVLPNYKEQTVSIQIESNSLSFSDQSTYKAQIE